MANIIQLPEQLANMIAAGEVIERPASVVKELVENSIDAQSSSIRIELVDFGLMKITVIDNGTGMEKENIPLALLRHATSKISSIEDLFHISSLGFRGEALPSIASVSTLKITSNPGGAEGYFFTYKAGTLTNEGSSQMPKGTKVEVENLFFNTPARYKHLGNQYQELNAIVEYLHRSALSHPEIAFTLQNNGKVIFQTSGNNNIPEIFNETYGSEIAKALISFQGENRLYQISGYTTKHNIFRSNRNAIHIIVNGRVIRSTNLSYAITEAYQTLLPVGKYPVTVLMIAADPTLIDVNVHPTKMEIRFTDEDELKQSVKTIISAALKNVMWQEEQKTIAKQKSERIYEYSPKFEEPVSPMQESIVKEEEEWDIFDAFEEQEENDEPIEKFDEIEEEPIKIEPEKQQTEQLQFVERPEERSFFRNLHYLGQYHQTYLLFEDTQNLYLIDQHAAMERIRYEKISKQFKESDTLGYDLLVPLTLEYSVGEIPLILALSEELKALGIQVEPFGRTTILVRTLPKWIPQGLEVEFVSDIINHLLKGQKTGKARLYDSLAKSLSCKQSIKANMTIRIEEVDQLLADLDACEMPYTCPHGRPTMITFKNYDIEKLFQRVQNG